jgi:hypothetical protein
MKQLYDPFYFEFQLHLKKATQYNQSKTKNPRTTCGGRGDKKV